VVGSGHKIVLTTNEYCVCNVMAGTMAMEPQVLLVVGR